MIGIEVNRIVYKGDGIAKEFPYTFTILAKSEIVVTIINPARERKVLTSDYFIDEEGKKVIYPGYAPGEEPAEAERLPVLPEGWFIVIQRKTPIDQLGALGDKWPFDVTEDALDKITRILQDINTNADRHLALSPEVEDTDPTLPKPEPNQGFYWDETGKKLVSADNPNLAAKKSAESAAKAEERAERAGAAESNAKASQKASEDARDRAESARDAAKKSEESAAESAAVATEKRKDIETHEANAGMFAKRAETAAASSEKSAESAAKSMASAGTYANQASASQQEARKSEVNAKASEDSAKAAASDAAASEASSMESAQYANSSAVRALRWAISDEPPELNDRTTRSARRWALNAKGTADSISKITADNVTASAGKAEEAAASAQAALDAKTTAEEMYRRFCVDIVGPPAASMIEADLFVAPGAAAMAAMKR